MTAKSLMGVTRRDVELLAGARCYADDVEPELFFIVGHGSATEAQVREAQKVCAGCPVREACLAQAEARGERYGVWGGRDFDVAKDHRCGTPAGYKRHRRRKERACDPCLSAKSAVEATNRERRKASA